MLRHIARRLADSFIMARGRRIFAQNSHRWDLPMSKVDKLLAGSFIILKDFGAGRFPPTFNDQAATYQAEIDYYNSMPGISRQENLELHLRKPFWGREITRTYCDAFCTLLEVLESIGVEPGSELLELGCGSGWMAEFLAHTGYSVLGTSISPEDIAMANRRVDALRAKGIATKLAFVVSPMEAVNEALESGGRFDAVFVFEALHHAFDWRRTLQASYRCLKPEGWMIIANEPNVLHTFISYRAARLSGTHEIGMSRKQIKAELANCGFREARVISPRFNNLVSAHWIAARK